MSNPHHIEVPPAGTGNAPGSDAAESLARRIKGVGQELCDAIGAIADRVPAKSRSPQDFARALKVHRTLAGRLLSAVRTDDPLAAISRMPRSEGLRMFFQAARVAAPREAIERAEKALNSFERIVHDELGGWDGFDAALTEWLPDAREKFELVNKQLAFKSMANILGAQADVQLDTAIYYPDASGARCDIAMIEGLMGLRRRRPSAQIPVVAFTLNKSAPQPLAHVLEDVPHAQLDQRYPMLEEFCSSPPPELRPVQNGEITTYVLSGNGVGMNSTTDTVTCSVVRSGRPMFGVPGAPPQRPHLSASVNIPAKTLLMNILLHKDVWPGGDPQLMVYDMHIRGMASPDDPARDLDRMAMVESVQPLGIGAARFRASEVGRHVEVVQYVCDRLGWKSDHLRGYRVRVQYPLINAQYCVVFDPPPVRAQ